MQAPPKRRLPSGAVFYACNQVFEQSQGLVMFAEDLAPEGDMGGPSTGVDQPLHLRRSPLLFVPAEFYADHLRDAGLLHGDSIDHVGSLHHAL